MPAGSPGLTQAGRRQRIAGASTGSELGGRALLCQVLVGGPVGWGWPQGQMHCAILGIVVKRPADSQPKPARIPIGGIGTGYTRAISTSTSGAL